jgi:hypothetical protein
MDPVIKAQWLADLRSGEFQQGIGFLTRTRKGVEENCCLGVLCKQAVAAGVIFADITVPVDCIDVDDRVTIYKSRTSFHDGSSMHLPVAVREWAGLTGVGIDHTLTSLAHRNDLKTPFPKIADIIEEKL